MFIPTFLIACGGKQAEPEVPVDEPAAPTEMAPAEVAPDAPAEAAAAPGDCSPGAVLYHQVNDPLRAPGGDMTWSLSVHDTGYWSNTAPSGETTGCLSADELAGLQTDIAAAEIAAPELGPGMARCMAMPTSEFTVSIGEQTATWKGPCGMSNPTASLDALMKSIGAISYARQ